MEKKPMDGMEEWEGGVMSARKRRRTKKAKNMFIPVKLKNLFEKFEIYHNNLRRYIMKQSNKHNKTSEHYQTFISKHVT